MDQPTNTPPGLPPTIATPTPVAAPEPKKGSWGAIISILLIVVLFVVGAFYTWGKRIAGEQPANPETQSATQ